MSNLLPASIPIVLGMLGMAGTLAAMNPATLERFQSVAAELNAEELERRRDYYAWLQQQRQAEPTLQEHLDRYASFAKFGDPLDDALVQSAQRLSATAFPPDLLAFYRSHGSFRGNDALRGLTIWRLDELLRLSSPETPRWQRVQSLGLVDAIRWTWGNDRPDLEPGSDRAVITAEQAEYLNSHYTVVGRWSDPSLEGGGYIYFDQRGRFGIFKYHQDTSRVDLLLGESPADMSWDEVMDAALTRVLEGDDYDY